MNRSRMLQGLLSSKWTPLNLFSNGEQGAWYDPSDLSTLFQDDAGTTPVTSDGDAVGLMLDKSGNDNHVSQSTAIDRPLYRTDGTFHWLEFDGDGDILSATTADILPTESAMCVGVDIVSNSHSVFIWSNNGGDDSRFNIHPTWKGYIYLDAYNTSDGRTQVSPPSFGKVVGLANVSPSSRIYRHNSVEQISEGAPADPVIAFNLIEIYDNSQIMPFYGYFVLNRSLSTDEVNKSESFMAEKTGVTL